MGAPLYPFKVLYYASVSEIQVGDRIPAMAGEPVGKCDSCHDPQGSLFYWLVTNTGPVHFFTDDRGGIRQMCAQLHTVPCSVCRPHAPPPDVDKAEHQDHRVDEASWWNA